LRLNNAVFITIAGCRFYQGADGKKAAAGRGFLPDISEASPNGREVMSPSQQATPRTEPESLRAADETMRGAA